MSWQFERLLAEESSAGTLESQGTFLLAENAALQKMACYALERPSMWVLKIAQAATQLEVAWLRLTVLRSHAQLELRRPDLGPPIVWRQLRDALTQPDRPASPALRDLSTGLWTLALASSRSFRLQAITGKPPGSEPAPLVEWDGSKLRLHDPSNPDTATRELRITVHGPSPDLKTRVALLFGGGRPFLDEMQELHRQAYLCPFPLEVDGRKSSSFRQAQGAVKGVARGLGQRPYPDPVCWLSSPPHDSLPAWQLYPGWSDIDIRIRRDRINFARQWASLSGDQVGLLAALCFDWESLGHGLANEASTIRWIRAGVVTDQTPLPELHNLTLGLVLHLSAEGLPTDLSGFRLRQEDPAFAQRRAAGLKALSEKITNSRPQEALSALKDIPPGGAEAFLDQLGALLSRLA